jgi:putative CocE/NonD family hydrolase
MTPYSRNGVCGCPPAALFASRGLISAVVDVRGTGGSEGTLEGNYFSPREQRDGAALIEYFGTQPYSSGKVGMAGGSYVGITQLLTAGQQPPHLAAIAPQVALSDLYRDAYVHGGVPNLFFDTQYIAVQGAPGTAGTNTAPDLLEQSLRAKLGQSPPGTIAFDYLERPYDDAFYRERSPISVADRIDVPVLLLGSWHDGLMRGQPEMFQALAGRRGVETRLAMDPCTHKGCGAPFAPMNDPPGQHDPAALVFEFLAKHLRGDPVPERPRVEYYVQGANEYASADRWPPAGTRFERLALGAGTLGVPAEGKADYVTDPVAGFSLAFNQYGTVAGTPYVPTDQRLEGPHGLTFRSAPLEAPLRLAGPLALRLVAASTAPDTDWHTKLADVAPDGSESVITEGALRASHRALDEGRSRPGRPYHTHVDPKPIEPGRFYEYDIEIWPTAYELAPGHRLQLRVTSTDLPTHFPGAIAFDRDRPQDVRLDIHQPATNTVRFEGSHLVVPVSGAVPPPLVAPGAPAAAGSAPEPHCRIVRRVEVRRGRHVLRARVRSGGKPIRGVRVRFRGPGFTRRDRTGRRGVARVRVRVQRRGRAKARVRLCSGKLRLRARRVGR